MAITTRTQCLISPNNATAFTSLISNSTSSSTRKRTRILPSSSSTSGRRMTLFTLIYISLAVITLFLSPSACAGCTPQFISLDDDGDEERPTDMLNKFDEDPWQLNDVMVREGSSFKLSCVLSHSHVVKWTKDNKFITPQDQNKWSMILVEEIPMDSFINTELWVYNSSTKFHPGEYKCTSICLDGPNGGVKVTVSIGITLDLNANLTNGVFTKPAARLRRVELICTAKVPQTTLMWYRERTDKDRTSDWENMSEVCDKPDVEVTDRKKPPDHCKLISESGENSTILKLEIKRVRKEASEKFSTLSDFRKYKCEANKDTKVTIRLIERISIVRSFGHRGVLSLTVLQGDTLELYCDIYGVKDDDFKSSGRLTVVWKKDGEYFNPMSEAVSFNSPKVKLQEGLIKDPEKGNPYRHGFTFEMAEPEHRGMYTCELGKKEGSEGNYQTIDSLEYYVRVKDKLGALWPFLGICGEVVLLCTIILIYEKRKSKAELEESDTDGSPDQNNSNSND